MFDTKDALLGTIFWKKMGYEQGGVGKDTPTLVSKQSLIEKAKITNLYAEILSQNGQYNGFRSPDFHKNAAEMACSLPQMARRSLSVDQR